MLEQRYLEVIGHLEQHGAADAEELAATVPRCILNENLYGVDLSPEAVEITQLALWIRSATPGQTLATLSQNIVHGNSLVHDAGVHPAGSIGSDSLCFRDWSSLERRERRMPGLRLRDRQSAVGADQAAGAGVLLAAGAGDCDGDECGASGGKLVAQAGIGRSGALRALPGGAGRRRALLTYCRRVGRSIR